MHLYFISASTSSMLSGIMQETSKLCRLIFIFQRPPRQPAGKTETAKTLCTHPPPLSSLLPQHSSIAASVRPETRGSFTPPSATSRRSRRTSSISGRRAGPRRSCALLFRPCRQPPAAVNLRRAALTPPCRWRSRGEEPPVRRARVTVCSQCFCRHTKVKLASSKLIQLSQFGSEKMNEAIFGFGQR